MSRSPNAQIAADEFLLIVSGQGYTKAEVWKAIATQLLSCDVWKDGEWKTFKGVIVYRERNDFKTDRTVMTRAENLSTYVASELGLSRPDLCNSIGRYWRMPGIANKQPHNLVGHAFRSILVEALKLFGDKGITYEEEVDPRREFPGHSFHTRSKNPKIDIVARRGSVTVALISSRWRFRHDRVDLIDEALAYSGPAKRANQNCQLYAWLGEFAPNRLSKVLENCSTSNPNGALTAAIHFQPKLILEALKENGRTVQLKSLDWLIDQTFGWK